MLMSSWRKSFNVVPTFNNFQCEVRFLNVCMFQYQQINAPEELMFFGWKDGSYKSKDLDLNNLVPIYFPETESMDDLPVLSSHDFEHKSLASEFVKQTYSDFVFVSFNMSFGSNDKDDGYDEFIAW